MAWIDELVRRDARPVVCAEIVLADTTLYYADADLEDGDTFWEGRIIGGCQILRGVDPEGQRLDIPPARIVFNNNTTDPTGEGHFGPLLREHRWPGKTVNLYLKFVAEDETIYSQLVYSGLAVPEELTPTQFTLSLYPVLPVNFGLIQRTITKAAFADAPDGTGAKRESTIGQGMNIILGTVAASGRGAVKLQMVDQTASAEKFAVASHWVNSIDAVFRQRAGVFSQLTGSGTDYTAYPDSGTDAEGNEYAYIQLASGKWAEGDEYFANVKGLMTGAALSLNGTDEYAYHANHADFQVTGDLCIPFSVKPTNTTAGAYLIVDKTVFSGAGYRIYRAAANLVISLIGASTGTVTAQNFFTAGTWAENCVVQYDASATEISVWKDGVEFARANNVTQTGCTLSGTIPGAIGSDTTRLTIGALSTGASPWIGEIAFIGIFGADYDTGAIPLPTATGKKGFWKFAGDLTDSSGNAHTLTGSGLDASNYGTDYTQPYKAVLAGNPARGLREMILQFSGLSTADLDTTSWDAAEATCTTRAYDTAGYFGGYIPLSPGQIEGRSDAEGRPSQWQVAQEIAASFGHTLYLTGDGTLGITSIDIADLEDTPDAYYRHPEDFMDDLSINLQPVPTVNEARVTFQAAHTADAGGINYVRGYNTVSQSDYGTREIIALNRTAQNSAVTGDVLTRLMQRASGAGVAVTVPVPGLWGLQSEVGDCIAVSHPRGFGEWEDEQLRVISVSADLLAGKSQLVALGMGSNYIAGLPAFGGQDTHVLDTSADTFVHSGATGTAYGTSTVIEHGGYSEWDAGEQEAENWEQRLCIRFDLSDIAVDKTVESATLTLRCLARNYPSGITVRQLNSTAWSDASTWSNLDGSGWDDGTHVGTTPLSSAVEPDIGPVNFPLNAAGISYLQTQVAAAGSVEFTLPAPLYRQEGIIAGADAVENYQFAASEHATTTWRPFLTIVVS